MTERRRTDRVFLRIPITVQGLDPRGNLFAERTTTVEVNRDGARIGLKNSLRVGDEVRITNLATGATALCHVTVECPQSYGDSTEWGVALSTSMSDLVADFWGITFEDLPEPVQPHISALLVCRECGRQELVAISHLEYDLLRHELILPRVCQKCRSVTDWEPVDIGNPGRPYSTRNESWDDGGSAPAPNESEPARPAPSSGTKAIVVLRRNAEFTPSEAPTARRGKKRTSSPERPPEVISPKDQRQGSGGREPTLPEIQSGPGGQEEIAGPEGSPEEVPSRADLQDWAAEVAHPKVSPQTTYEPEPVGHLAEAGFLPALEEVEASEVPPPQPEPKAAAESAGLHASKPLDVKDTGQSEVAGAEAPQGAERRVARRVPVRVPILVQASDGATEETVTKDVSKTGLSFPTDLDISRGDSIEVVVGHGVVAHPIKQSARVAWRWPTILGVRAMIGAQFTSPGESAQS